MSIIVVEGGSPSATPALQKVEKGVLNASELDRVVLPRLGIDNPSKTPQNEFKGVSIPPLTKVNKKEAPPLTKVEPMGPPPLKKIEKDTRVDMVVPPLTIIKGGPPANAPELKVAVKKEFIGLILESEGDESIVLSRVFIGNEIKSLIDSTELEKLMIETCSEEVRKETLRKKKYLTEEGVSQTTRFKFNISRSTPGVVDKYRVVATIKVQVIIDENVTLIDTLTQVGDASLSGVSSSVLSSKVFSLIIVENSTNMNVNIYPSVINNIDNTPISNAGVSNVFMGRMHEVESSARLSR